jgi:ubiquinone/menaquinone biosynthesis C-methylase UbiE
LQVEASHILDFDSSERQALQDVRRFVDMLKAFRWKACADLGCGTGYFAIPIALEWTGSRVVFAIDRATPMLEVLDRRVAERGLTNLKVIQGVSDRIPLPDGAVELAVMGNLYHELRGRLNYLKEVARILKPGGVVVITDWDKEEEADIGPPLDRRVAVEQVKSDLAFAGFTKVRNHFLYTSFYVISARKHSAR